MMRSACLMIQGLMHLLQDECGAAATCLGRVQVADDARHLERPHTGAALRAFGRRPAGGCGGTAEASAI